MVKTRSGIQFKNGKLYIFNSSDAVPSITVIRGWPNTMAWQKKDPKSQFQCFRPEIYISRRESNNEKLKTDIDEYFNRYQIKFLKGEKQPPYEPKMRINSPDKYYRAVWLLTIPEHIRDIISHYRDRHFQLLSFLSHCGDKAIDLHYSNPALFFMLANNWVYHKPVVQRPLRSARALLLKKQRKIAFWLGFPDEERAVKILKKVHIKSVNINNMLFLRDGIINDDNKRILSHCPRINQGVLRIVTDDTIKHHFDMPFILEISKNSLMNNKNYFTTTLIDIKNMLEMLNEDADNIFFKNYQSFINKHDSLVEKINLIELSKEYPFPDPPFEGLDDVIVPITDERMLMDEGDEMHHCVRSWYNSIVRYKISYVYKLDIGEYRATIGLRKRYDGSWYLNELRGKNNQEVSSEVKNYAFNWLNSVQNDTEFTGEKLYIEVESINDIGRELLDSAF